MNEVMETPGVLVASAEEVTQMEETTYNELMEVEKEIDDQRLMSSLASHIRSVFQENKDSRTTSNIEMKMLESLRAYNGHYDPEDLARIRESGGSEIYMNLTPTKCRAAMSWIRDILLPAKENAWELTSSPIPDLPQEIKDKVQEELDKIIEETKKASQPQPQQGQPQEGKQPQAGPPQPEAQPAPADAQRMNASQAQKTISDTNQMRLDLEDAFLNEIKKIANAEVKKFEHEVSDQLAEGNWDMALSDFIEDFCVFQVAIMKGPVISKKVRLKWVEGEPVPTDDFIFLNKRVSPLDIYPSSSATDITDGNLCEHLRLHRNELYNLIGVKGYKAEVIREILATSSEEGYISGLNTYIEDEKAVEEYRGDTYRANKGVYHGIHYFGTASYKVLADWGYSLEELGGDTEREFEVEAIMVADKVIKCEINTDPLLRRPYYKACFQNIPGSFWGRSLPELMRDIQRMCNATARALANNMGIASGPQVEIYVDRLAADEELEHIYPFKQWQVTSDPGGGSGRAVQFWQPQSNAGELLTVYEKFEVMADDATGIPRYAYGNERTGGAAQTASGLSMLLESASKGIKDAIRHIDDGLIKPRVEYQFYWNILTNPDLKFSGDVVVVPRGSQALTMKGAQEMRRNEFLQILSNPLFTEIVGVEGLAEILREMAKSLGLGTDIVPSRIELKRKQEEAKAAQQQAQQQQQEMAQQEQATGVQQVQMQTQQAEAASQRSAQLKQMELELKKQMEDQKIQLRAMEMNMHRELEANRNTMKLATEQLRAAQKDRDTNKNVALSVQSGYEDKNNQS